MGPLAYHVDTCPFLSTGHVSRIFLLYIPPLVDRLKFETHSKKYIRMAGAVDLQLPPGFRFHPTDDELVMHYLCRKCASQQIDVPIIKELDLYKHDPWDLPGKKQWLDLGLTELIDDCGRCLCRFGFVWR